MKQDPSDETAAAGGDGSAPKPRKVFPPGDATLRAELKAYKAAHALSNAQLGVKLGIDATYVSKYLSGTNDFDAARVDRLAGDLLKTEKVRGGAALEIFPSFVTRRIAGNIAIMRKLDRVGLVFSAAGLGKSCGMRLYQRENPLSIAFTATKKNCCADAMQRMIFAAVENKSWKRNTPVWEFLCKHLMASGRPVLIDNFQRLHRGALQYLFDLQDETGVPMVGFGNPEVLETISKVDQMFSRIGIKDEIVLPEFAKATKEERKDVADVTDGILQRMLPDWAEAVRDLSLQVAWRRGHFRALRAHVTLAHELSLRGGALADPRTAFQAAHTKLVSDYTLEVEE